jgi:hypothetical protein
MKFTYSADKLVFLFEAGGELLHSLAAEFENITRACTFVPGQRIEMHDRIDGVEKQVIGHVAAVDHFITVDPTGQFHHTVKVCCDRSQVI